MLWIRQNDDMEHRVYNFVFDKHWKLLSEQNDLNTEIEGPILLIENGILQMISDMMHREFDDE